ncbi:hypothetical protein ES708_26591 [subsurface metagenome]
MVENLAFLPRVGPSSLFSETDPHYYVYDYQGSHVSEAKLTSNYQTYGVLYNWPAALNACPTGWHLPSDEEWKQLEMYLGMSQSEAENTGWRGTDEGGKVFHHPYLVTDFIQVITLSITAISKCSSYVIVIRWF